MKTEPRKAGVMGGPVSHSLSPALHGHWLARHGIAGSYERIPVRPEELPAALARLAPEGWAGVNLTVPHKEAALALVDTLDAAARAIGAVNTVVVGTDGRLDGRNTDAYGFIENLRQNGPPAPRPVAVVLGAGGAARAVCHALAGAGFHELRIVNRTITRAMALAEAARAFGIARVVAPSWTERGAALDGAGLLVNTTILGMAGAAPLNLDLAALPADAVVNDIVYAPLETALLAAARARGNPVVDGLGMLLWQAQAGFASWFGVAPAVDAELRAAVLAAREAQAR
ncbi:MAG: shikimate dehydrogenase [Alphaproteobacteria bacterium]|nr:shikimate dehydrogenase [Alphaproteobacteria bacterium]